MASNNWQNQNIPKWQRYKGMICWWNGLNHPLEKYEQRASWWHLMGEIHWIFPKVLGWKCYNNKKFQSTPYPRKNKMLNPQNEVWFRWFSFFSWVIFRFKKPSKRVLRNEWWIWIQKNLCSLAVFEQVSHSLGIQSPCQRMIGVYNHLLRKVVRFHETILRRWLDP